MVPRLGVLALLIGSLRSTLSALASPAPPPLERIIAPKEHAGLSVRDDVAVVRGVNIGGFLVTESWITPSLYQSKGLSGDVPDEWTIGVQLGKEDALSLLKEHWETFYTRDDFVDIKDAGLTHVRIPIGYWAVDVLESEPYVSGQYPYLIRAVLWARELSLGVMIDLHGLPGSQNGQDNSGRDGPVEFSNNATNVQRSLNVLRNLTEEFTQPVYGGVVQTIEVMNEPRLYNNSTTFTMAFLKEVYALASDVIRNASSNGMTVTIHDAFWSPSYWSDYDPSSNSSSDGGSSPDWLELDTHQYYAFAPYENLPRTEILERICNVSKVLKQPSSGIPKTVVGEWSLESGSPPNASIQDRGLSRDKRTWLRLLFEAQLAAYSPTASDQSSKGFYFWTWKTQYDYVTWSYRSGIQNGYIPSDVSNSSRLVFPVLTDGANAGCVDSTFNWTAPVRAQPDVSDGGGPTSSPQLAICICTTFASVLALSV